MEQQSAEIIKGRGGGGLLETPRLKAKVQQERMKGDPDDEAGECPAWFFWETNWLKSMMQMSDCNCCSSLGGHFSSFGGFTGDTLALLKLIPQLILQNVVSWKIHL